MLNCVLCTEIVLVEHQPSVIATAAVLTASDPQLTQKTVELKLSVISLGKHINNVSFLVCATGSIVCLLNYQIGEIIFAVFIGLLLSGLYWC